MPQTETNEKSTLTMKIDRNTLAELKAAAKIIGATSYASLVHQSIVLKIREAKGMVSREEFERVRDEQFERISVRSKIKSEERRKIVAKALNGEELIENFEVPKVPKPKISKKNSKSITTKNGETLRFVEEDDGSSTD